MKITNKYEKKVIGDELLLVPTPKSGLKEALILNKISSVLYNMIEEGLTVEKIIKSLSSEYDVTVDILSQDIEKTLNILLEKEVVSG